MWQPEGIEVKGKEDFVCKLKKSLYVLKQAYWLWYKKFDTITVNLGYKRTTSDHRVFMKRYDDGDFIILLLYVNGMCWPKDILSDFILMITNHMKLFGTNQV